MKRFLLSLALFLVGLVALYSVRSLRSSPPPDRLVARAVRSPDGRTMQTTYFDRHGRVIDLVRNAAEVDEESAVVLDSDDGQVVHREPAEGLPVPVIPGTRTTEARVEAPDPVRPDSPRPRTYRRPPAATPPVGPSGIRLLPALTSVTGRLSATEERARDDARRQFERLLADRLAPEVPRSWKVPANLVDGLIRQVVVVPRERDYGTVYEATLKVDLSPSRLAEILAVYHREQVVNRLVALGTLLAFVLVCLAAISGYIRADEATKGYYTNRLRLAAAAGVAAAGVILYRKFA